MVGIEFKKYIKPSSWPAIVRSFSGDSKNPWNHQLSWPYIVHQLYSPKQTKKCSVFDSNLMTPNNIYFCVAKIKTSKMLIMTGGCQPLRFFGRVRYLEQSLDIMAWINSITWDESLTPETHVHQQDDVNPWYKISKIRTASLAFENCWVGNLSIPIFGLRIWNHVSPF